MSNEESPRAMPTVEAVRVRELELQLAKLQEGIADAKPEVAKTWQPNASTPLWASILVGVLGASAPAALTMIPMPFGGIVAIALGGLSLGLSTHFGIKSSGTAKPPDAK